MAARAGMGEYDDIESNHPTPKILLVAELEQMQLWDLSDRVKQGEFDNTSQEWQALISNGGIFNGVDMLDGILKDEA
jgi:hypothetical protein